MNVSLRLLVGLIIFVLLIYLAYLDAYGKGDSPFNELIEFCKRDGDNFADTLGDFANQDIRIVKAFLDIAMPTISLASYEDSILTNNYSDVVRDAEEAFALFVLENYFNRWIYQAELHRQKKDADHLQVRNETSGGEVRNDISGTTGQEGGRSSSVIRPPEVDIPDVKYQRKIKMRNDQVQSAGKWTEKGLKRYDTILKAVMERRKNREPFEDQLTDTYIHSIDSGRRERFERKRKLEEMMEEKQTDQPANVVFVTDVLKIEYL